MKSAFHVVRVEIMFAEVKHKDNILNCYCVMDFYVDEISPVFWPADINIPFDTWENVIKPIVSKRDRYVCMGLILAKCISKRITAILTKLFKITKIAIYVYTFTDTYFSLDVTMRKNYVVCGEILPVDVLANSFSGPHGNRKLFEFIESLGFEEKPITDFDRCLHSTCFRWSCEY